MIKFVNIYYEKATIPPRLIFQVAISDSCARYNSEEIFAMIRFFAVVCYRNLRAR
jgi:hypothetical protein